MTNLVEIVTDARFIAGLVAGVVGFLVPVAVAAWCFGHDAAMRTVETWLRQPPHHVARTPRGWRA